MSAPGASASAPSPPNGSLPKIIPARPARPCLTQDSSVRPDSPSPRSPHQGGGGCRRVQVGAGGWRRRGAFSPIGTSSTSKHPARVSVDAHQPKRSQALTHVHARISPSCSAGHGACVCVRVCIRLCVIQCAATQPVPRSLLCCCASDQICLPQPVCHLWRVHTRARAHEERVLLLIRSVHEKRTKERHFQNTKQQESCFTERLHRLSST